VLTLCHCIFLKISNYAEKKSGKKGYTVCHIRLLRSKLISIRNCHSALVHFDRHGRTVTIAKSLKKSVVNINPLLQRPLQTNKHQNQQFQQPSRPIFKIKLPDTSHQKVHYLKLHKKIFQGHKKLPNLTIFLREVD
jgi:hypothetical protein